MFEKLGEEDEDKRRAETDHAELTLRLTAGITLTTGTLPASQGRVAPVSAPAVAPLPGNNGGGGGG